MLAEPAAKRHAASGGITLMAIDSRAGPYRPDPGAHADEAAPVRGETLVGPGSTANLGAAAIGTYGAARAVSRGGTHEGAPAIPPSLTATGLSTHVPWMLGVGAATSLAVYALWLRDPRIVEENHLVENSQAGFLVLAAIIHGWRGWTMDIAERRLRIGLALFCVALVLREVDVDRLGDEAIMSVVEVVLRATLVVVCVIWGWRSRDVLETLWANRVRVAFSSLGLLVVVGCVLYGASWPFDKYPRQLGGGDRAMLFEETVQLLATMTLLAARLPHVFSPCRLHRSSTCERIRSRSA